MCTERINKYGSDCIMIEMRVDGQLQGGHIMTAVCVDGQLLGWHIMTALRNGYNCSNAYREYIMMERYS